MLYNTSKEMNDENLCQNKKVSPLPLCPFITFFVQNEY